MREFGLFLFLLQLIGACDRTRVGSSGRVSAVPSVVRSYEFGTYGGGWAADVAASLGAACSDRWGLLSAYLVLSGSCSVCVVCLFVIDFS